MISAPRFGVVLNHARGDLADRRFPRRAVAFVVSDDQVRRGVQIRAAVEPAGRIDMPNGNLAQLLVAQTLEPRDQLALQGLGLRAGADNPARLTPLPVDVKPAQPQAVRARAAPIASRSEERRVGKEG